MSMGLYRRRSQECRQAAETTSDPGQREKWRSLAEEWSRLAAEVQGRQLRTWRMCEGDDEPTSSPRRAHSFSAGQLTQH
jgi:hypothetical protein